MEYNPILKFKRKGFKRLSLKNLYYKVWFKKRRGETTSEIVMNDEFDILKLEEVLSGTVLFDTLLEYKDLISKKAKKDEDIRLGVVC